MSDPANDYIPGRSLFVEISDLREQMTNLRTAMGLLVDLQREVATKVEAALTKNPIGEGETATPAQVA